jgi:transcriptional regulator with XRE-family HTH domain
MDMGDPVVASWQYNHWKAVYPPFDSLSRRSPEGIMLRLFGEKMRVIREHKRLSQSELARLLESTRGHVNNLEVGRKMPSLQFVIALASFANISPDYLVRDTFPTVDLTNLDEYPHPSSSLSLDHIGGCLRHMRLERGLTQKDLAEQLGLRTQAYISLLESGHKVPSISILIDLADRFSVPIDIFLDTISG